MVDKGISEELIKAALDNIARLKEAADKREKDKRERSAKSGGERGWPTT